MSKRDGGVAQGGDGGEGGASLEHEGQGTGVPGSRVADAKALWQGCVCGVQLTGETAA